MTYGRPVQRSRGDPKGLFRSKTMNAVLTGAKTVAADLTTRCAESAPDLPIPCQSRWRESCKYGGCAVSSGFSEADDGDRTRDPQLGKLMLYQLSYVRAGSILAWSRRATFAGMAAQAPSDHASACG